MANRAPRPPTERMQWITSHMDLAPKEALAAAKARWPTITLQSIYQLRNEARRKGIAVPRLSRGVHIKHPERYRAVAARISAKTAKADHPHRPLSPTSKFILSLPLDMPNREVIERGQKAGLKLTRGQIDAARARHRKHLSNGAAVEAPETTQLAIFPEPQAPARKPRKGQLEATVLPLGQLSTDEADFFGLVLGIGWNRASRLMAQFRVQFFDLIKAHTHDQE